MVRQPAGGAIAAPIHGGSTNAALGLLILLVGMLGIVAAATMTLDRRGWVLLRRRRAMAPAGGWSSRREHLARPTTPPKRQE